MNIMEYNRVTVTRRRRNNLLFRRNEWETTVPSRIGSFVSNTNNKNKRTWSLQSKKKCVPFILSFLLILLQQFLSIPMSYGLKQHSDSPHLYNNIIQTYQQQQNKYWNHLRGGGGESSSVVFVVLNEKTRMGSKKVKQSSSSFFQDRMKRNTKSGKTVNISSNNNNSEEKKVVVPKTTTTTTTSFLSSKKIQNNNKKHVTITKTKTTTTMKQQSKNNTAVLIKKGSSKQPIQQSSSQPKEDPTIMFLMRLLFLTYYGSLGSLLPYLPVYYDSIGHGGQVIGLLGAVKPLTTFLVAPAWGILSDQTQQPFRILQVTFLVSLLGQILVALRHDAMFLTVMVFITALFNAPVKSLLDTMVMDQLHDPSASYGRLRLWGQMGFGLGSSGAGVLLSKSHQNIEWEDVSIREWVRDIGLLSSRTPILITNILGFFDKLWQTLTGYKLLFFVHFALSIPTWICIQVFHRMNKQQAEIKQQQQEQNGSNQPTTVSTTKTKTTTKILPKPVVPKPKSSSLSITDGISLLLHNSDAMLFFFLVFVVGVSSGVVENFAYVRIREVGGTGKDMGLSRLVSSLAGAPMFWYSGPLTEALGADRVLVLSLISYIIRFITYAFMQHPVHGLPAEALRGVTFAAFWSTSTVYAHRVSPPGMHATMLMFLNAMYGGLGQSLGSIIGGKLQHRYGTVQTFLYSAAFDFCFVILVILYLSFGQGEAGFKNPVPIVPPDRIKVKIITPPTTNKKKGK